MSDFQSTLRRHNDLPEAQQKKAGKAIEGKMSSEHETFLKDLIALLDKNSITVGDVKSFLNANVYDKLPQKQKDSVDLALLNINDQIRLIEDFYRSTKTPNSSPHLQTMIEHLWQQKSKLEEQLGDVFKF